MKFSSGWLQGIYLACKSLCVCVRVNEERERSRFRLLNEARTTFFALAYLLQYTRKSNKNFVENIKVFMIV